MKKDFFIQFKSALISKDMIKTIVGGYGNPSGTGGSGRKCCSEVRRNCSTSCSGAGSGWGGFFFSSPSAVNNCESNCFGNQPIGSECVQTC